MNGDLTLTGGSPFDSIRRVREDGREYWDARELMPVMEYRKWENFAAIVEKARASLAIVQGAEAAAHHFPASGTDGGRWGNQRLGNFELTRFGAYLTAMAADDTKRAVAEARIYFAVQTRRAEVAEQQQALPKSYAEALRELAATVEERDTAQAKVIELHPKAESWDKLADTGADYSCREAAYILNRDPAISTGQNRLLALLRSWRLIDRNDKPYANHSTHVTLRPQTRVASDGDRVQAKPQVRITVAGLSYLHKRLGGVEPLDFSEVAS